MNVQLDVTADGMKSQIKKRAEGDRHQIRQRDAAGGVQMQRPLCVYPQIPEYKGTGDPSLAASFSCVTDQREFNEIPAPEYGP
jgi:hypothetical protein